MVKALSNKPDWWGKTIITPCVLNRLKNALFILLIVSFLIGGISMILPYKNELNNLSRFLSTSFNFFSYVIIFSAFFYSVFFFFRAFINLGLLFSERKNGYFGNNLEGLWNPLYGLKEDTLTKKGLKHRNLFIEGTVGFILCIILVLALNYLLTEANKLW